MMEKTFKFNSIKEFYNHSLLLSLRDSNIYIYILLKLKKPSLQTLPNYKNKPNTNSRKPNRFS